MKLKGYQEKVLRDLTTYLRDLSKFREKYDEIKVLVSDAEFDFPEKAWQKFKGGEYHSKHNGIGEPLPDVYLKVPTGGGKTLLACHAIDLINKNYLNRQTGVVLWIVPSTQIYRQTISRLKDRNDPYRQILDISSGGRTMIREKLQPFTKNDVENNLVVLMLMLQASNRQNKESLKMFQDASGYTDFFPAEDDYVAQEGLIELVPNLSLWSALGAELGADAREWTNQRQIQTSLGNTLRLLKPLVIMDEGHKAYGRLARETIQGFNPSFVLELSATPPEGSNKLVEVTGKELDGADMIKLDIHLKNDPNRTWKDTLLASYSLRNELEAKADEYRQNTDVNIRPISLIQAERVGKDQIDAGFIHSEHVKQYLIEQCGVPEEQIAIKTSEKDDLEGIELLAADCPIRYIITKQALQEGWDCPFAYVLTILTNPRSATAITQLVGRILRQPFAKKTEVKQLDECYVFTFQPDANRIVREIKAGLEGEGMGDLAGRIAGEGAGDFDGAMPERQLSFRDVFKGFEGRIFLPSFAVKDTQGWRPIRFEIDILSRVDWSAMKLDKIDEIVLEPRMDKVGELAIGYRGENLRAEAETLAGGGSLEIDEVFLAQQLADIVPNPWICFDLGRDALNRLRTRYENDKFIAGNFIFFVEEFRRILDSERDRLSRIVFENMLDKGEMFFYIIDGQKAISIEKRLTVRSALRLRNNDEELERSLLDYVASEEFNDFERDFALRLDSERKLLWWYRNVPRHDYFVQGWRRHRIFPDFLAAQRKVDASRDLDRVLVLETKGAYLNNEDTGYKQAVFDLCNAQDVSAVKGQLPPEPVDCTFEYKVIFDKNWRNELNTIFGS